MNLLALVVGAASVRIEILCSRLQRLSGGSTTQQRIRFQPAHAGSTSPCCLRFAEMRCPASSIGVHQSIKLMFQPTVHFGLLAPLFHSFTTYNKKYFRVFFFSPSWHFNEQINQRCSRGYASVQNRRIKILQGLYPLDLWLSLRVASWIISSVLDDETLDLMKWLRRR